MSRWDLLRDLVASVSKEDTLDVWRAPWVARSFEIDCPCPNGQHCGGSHTCEELAAPEEYPGTQCVVQIDVPGLETFAAPTARFIATLRNAWPALQAGIPALLAELQAVEQRCRDLEWERMCARAEVDVLRGAICEKDGAGPCGACLKCARKSALDSREMVTKQQSLIDHLQAEVAALRKEKGTDDV